jgi:ELWxxDGT repeat protein
MRFDRCRGIMYVCALVVLWGAAGMRAQAQPAHLVKDLNTAEPRLPLSNKNQLAALGSVVLFTSDDAVYGAELWRGDGTAAGTARVTDICPGACSSRPDSLTVSNGLLFFAADDGVHGRELWKSDGTAAGTAMVADVHPGINYPSAPGNLMDAGGVLFFLEDDGVHGQELWRTDGTAAGTRLVRDIRPGTPNSSYRLLAASGNLVLFAADDGAHGLEPWVSDGTEAGTVMLGDFNPGDSLSIPFDNDPVLDGPDAAAAPQGGFLFAAADSYQPSLWYSDGTPGGTVLLKAFFAYPRHLTPSPAQGVVYFTASDDTHGTELWKTDGTAAGTSQVKDIRPNGASLPLDLTVAGDRLFFRADDGVHGYELWTSDGTEAGTVLVADLLPGAAPGFPLTPVSTLNPYHFGLSAFGGGVVFLGFGPNGLQLWRSDGTAAGTVPLSPGGISESTVLADDVTQVAGGQVYFLSGPVGTELWSSDGSAPGTRRVMDLATSTSAFRLLDGKPPLPGSLAPFGGQLVFAASDGVSGSELWTTDGTAQGTRQIVDLVPGAGSSLPYQLRALGNRLIFRSGYGVYGSDGNAGAQQLAESDGGDFPLLPDGSAAFFTLRDVTTQLWKTDGSPAGTSPFWMDAGYFMTEIPAVRAPGGKALIVTAIGGAGYKELWVTDGTSPGTLRLTGPAEKIEGFTDAGGTIFFVLYPFVDVTAELWKTDGTVAGTVLVKHFDLNPFPITDPNLRQALLAAPAGGPLVFVAGDPAAGTELWRSDGTEAGTVRLADIQPGPGGSEPRGLTAVGNRVYFAADDGAHGREIWMTDGTPAGTRLVADLFPGPGSSQPDNLTAVDTALVFSATDGAHGVELWRTAGRAVGTRMVQDIAPGALSSSPSAMTAAGPNVYFPANDNATGFELWAVPKSNVLATFGDVPTSFFAWRFVEALAARGVTGGCGDGNFCPASPVTRAEAAVLLLAAAGTPPPPATGARFDDVPPGYWAGPWIEDLANQGIVAGCSVTPPLYCPTALLTRAQMAVLLVGARHETPPPATGTRFTDVPAGFWAARWIEQIAADGITGGCGGGNFCPDQPVTRAEMAVFLTVAFHLPSP